MTNFNISVLHLHSETHLCARKIKLITPIRTALINGIKTPYCYVYTFQEMYDWGELDSVRTNEKMIAFGDIAKTLQFVNYVKHEVGLTYKLNTNYQNVIIGFNEQDRSKSFWGSAGNLPLTIRSFDYDFSNEDPLRKIQKETKATYNANVKEYHTTFWSYPAGKRLHDGSYEQLTEFINNAKSGQYIECQKVVEYGDYKLYAYKTVKRK